MQRSGSTWLYNVIRLLLESKSCSVYGAWVEDYNPLDEAEYHLVKTHRYIPSLSEQADLILSSRRDLRDIAASLIRKRWIDKSNLINLLESNIENYEQWRPCSAYDVEYTEIIYRPIETISIIASLLECELNYDHIVMINDMTKDIAKSSVVSPDKHYDEKTLIHPDHITDGKVGSFRNFLPPDLIDKLDQHFSEWLEKYSYLSKSN